MTLNNFIDIENNFLNVKFFDKNHTYIINQTPAKLSVSGLIKNYEKPFEKQKIAKLVAFRSNRSVEDVLLEWDFLKDYSCHKGSEFHNFVENYFHRKQVTINKDAIVNFFEKRKNFYKPNSIQMYYEEMAHLIKNFLNFYDWWKQDHILLKTEFVIGDEDSSICGTIDNLSYNKKTNELVIFDYKTNKQIKRKNSRNDTFLAPIQHLSHCEYIKYSLQLNLYQHIFEKKSKFLIPKSYIVWVASKKNYDLIETLYLRKEAQMLVAACK